MKKLLVIALALFTLNGMAQKKERPSNHKEKSEARMQRTPNDVADLKSKHMTLKLDLTDAQQKKVHAVILKQAQAKENFRKNNKPAEGEKRERPSQEEFMLMQNARLDQQIEMKREMKAIFSAEQYAKFEEMQSRRHDKKAKRGKNKSSKRDDDRSDKN